MLFYFGDNSLLVTFGIYGVVVPVPLPPPNCMEGAAQPAGFEATYSAWHSIIFVACSSKPA
jgi:hypothetical protein